jgi:hypothetical protein
MRRCPECYEIYDDGERFCEVDGQRLLADPAFTGTSHDNTFATSSAPHVGQPWLTGLVGVAVGILICSAIYIVHAMWPAQIDPENQQSSFSMRSQEPTQSMRSAPANVPRSTETPADDEAVDAEAEASPEEPSPTEVTPNQTATARLNQGPVSTGPREKDKEKTVRTVQTIILMQDGTSVEVDAAWKDGQGVWYRRGGLVSFVESQRVKEITARAEPPQSPENEVVP